MKKEKAGTVAFIFHYRKQVKLQRLPPSRPCVCPLTQVSAATVRFLRRADAAKAIKVLKQHSVFEPRKAHGNAVSAAILWR